MTASTIILGVILAVFIAAIPGEIASRRGHKNAGAIRLCGYIGILIWPCWLVGLVWSLTDPGPIEPKKRARRTTWDK